MFKVGEKVRFLDDVGTGTIVRFKDEKTVIVEDEFGMQNPHPISKLVPAERDRVSEKPPVEKPKVEPTKAVPKPISHSGRTEQLPELALAFVSTKMIQPEVGDLELLFVNNSRYHLLINIGTKDNDEWFSLFHGEVFPLKEQFIQSLRRQDVGTVSNLNVDVIFFGTTGYESRCPVSCNLKMKATRFVKSGNYLTYEGIENPAIAVPIENEKVVVAPTSSIRIPPTLKQPSRSFLPVTEEEVDLHLEELLGTDPAGMPDHEKFLTQMRHFEHRLNNALTHNYAQITFIHGVGTGRLKEAIRKELTEYELKFEDGPFHKYGVGATVVILR